MVLGLGTGTTADVVVGLIARKVAEGLRVRCVPTSARTAALAADAGIPLADLNGVRGVDLAIDGADEVDGRKRCIKGGGGALLHEKIVASAAGRTVIVVDAGKLVGSLGKFPLPVEVSPFAREHVRRLIGPLGASVSLRTGPDGPFVTDEGNNILDCSFGAIADPQGLAAALATIPGVVEHGLFLSLADEVIVGEGDTAYSMK